ncbi:MAG TPA: signal recognition particle protein [Steroidobacteraceae bacterium]|nr:signal recognition particle protein [Steroidobacteraceae bacterium]
MFDKLTERLSRAVQTLRGRGRVTEENVAETLREVRMALLEADVALPVVKSFIDSVRTRALGAEVSTSLTPGQAFIGILHRELIALLGEARQGFALNVQPPQVVLLAGLQGAGKTTTAGKLARWLIEREKRRVLLVSTDVRRPAAILQLQRIAETVGADFFPSSSSDRPVAIATAALEAARRGVFDTLIIDTAGRLHVDEELMQEVQGIDRAVSAHQRLFVVDAMGGQDALNAARAFGNALALTGIVLTKADGDARGGAALSVRFVTGQPIVFLGVGEKLDALSPFDPERMASRILGMGDVVSLVEDVQRKVDAQQAEKLARKVVQGKRFTLLDLREQLEQVRKLGGLSAVMDKLPAQLASRASGMQGEQADRELRRQIAIIDSMTHQERSQAGIIDGSRRRRIAAGAGAQVQDVNRLLKQFLEMQRVMKSMKGGKLGRLLAGLRGAMPPGPPR